jgi:benzoyl-CoA reductase/2-hydroxyglutaryl-CoA dehydratase subunit BcrC/BadD/HgdB
MPDIMFKPILDRIARDFHVPIIHYMRDTHASDTAYQTRLEAFAELLRRKEKL